MASGSRKYTFEAESARLLQELRERGVDIDDIRDLPNMWYPWDVFLFLIQRHPDIRDSDLQDIIDEAITRRRPNYETGDFDAEARQLLLDLHNAGMEVVEVNDLITAGLFPEQAIEVLIEWLPRAKNVRIKDIIARALTLKHPNQRVARALVEEFRSLPDEEIYIFVRWTIGAALERVAESSVERDLIDILRNKLYGMSRQMCAMALGRLQTPAGVAVLTELLREGDLVLHALIGLRRSAKLASDSRPAIERFLNDPNAGIRREARSALKAIDRQK